MDDQFPVRERQKAIERTDVPGWGVDIDAKNDATYPMRDRSADDSPGMNWTRPSLQPEDAEPLQSLEHNRRPAVYGTSSPPTGLSGMIRRSAFGHSESKWSHWLMLMLADRVNSVEGVIDDIAHGKIPNIVEEMGLAAEWKYNRQSVIKKAAITLAVTGAVAGLGYYLLSRSRSSRSGRP